MLKYYGLPFWVVGIIASFALPFVPHWGVWLAAALVLLAASRRFAAAGMMLCVLLGAAYGVFRTEAALSSQWPLNGASESVLTVEVADMPRGDGRRVQFAAKAWTEDGRQFDLLLSDYQKRDWAVGSRWKVSARLKPVIGEVNLRGLNREAWALANGLDGAGTLGKGRSLVREGGGVGLAVWRDAVSRRWQAVEADSPDFSDGIGLMRALSIGEQSALRPELWQAFRPLGLTHLVSISGLHVTMVAVLVGWLVKLIFRRLPWIPAKPRVWILAGGAAGALFYALLAGFSVPTQRSVLMLAAFAWAWWRSSLSSGWTAWWQALAVVLLLDPLAVRLGRRLDLGFGRSSERTRLAFGCTRTMGGDGFVSGIVGLYFCVLAHHQSFGQCGDDSLVFLGFDTFGVAGVGVAVRAFAMGGGRFGGIHFARLGLAGGGIA